MIQPNLTYMAFDDRRFMLIGIPFIALTIPFLFYSININHFKPFLLQEYFESLTYTSVYWIYNRQLMIYLRKKYDDLSQTMKRFGLQLLIILFTTPIISLIVTGCINVFHYLTGGRDVFEPTFLQSMTATYFLTFTLIVVYDAIYFFYKYKAAILEKEQIQRAHIQGQLDNLRNQINPHFLFNSLNTLMNLIPTDSDRAMNYLSKLSKFYRYTVSNQEAALVPLQTEMDNVRIYADLLEERFHQGIKIEVPTDIEVPGAQILPLCLQLLIENAVKHNIVGFKKPLNIQLQIIESGKYLEVRNNIQKKIQEVSSTGMGLKNIQQRVAFFTKTPLRIREEAGDFTVAVPLIYV